MAKQLRMEFPGGIIPCNEQGGMKEIPYSRMIQTGHYSSKP
jgi:hypothetical protein